MSPAIAELRIDSRIYDGIAFYLDRSGMPLLPSATVRELLAGIVKPELIDAVAARERLVSSADLYLVGLALSYDPDTLILRMSIPSRARIPRDLAARPAKPKPSGLTLDPEPFSAILGLGLELSPRYRFEEAEAFQLPFSLELRPALGLFGLALEANLELGVEEEVYFEAKDARLLYDLPGAGVRFQAGLFDTRASSFQSSAELLGLAAFREKSLPGAATGVPPLGEFDIEDRAVVTIELNGAKLRTLRLEPGAYRLSDIPLATGLNDVVVVIAEEGKPERRIKLGLPYDGGLLRQGALDWYAGAGFARTGLDEPFGTAFISYGLTAQATGGLHAQAGFGTLLGGASLLWASPLGSLALEPVLSWNYQGAETPDFALRALWRLSIPNRRYLPLPGLGFEYRSSGYGPPSTHGNSPESDEEAASFRYSAQLYQALPWSAGLSAAAELSLAEGGAFRRFSFSAGLFQNLPGSLFLSIAGGLDRDWEDGYSPTLSFALSVAPPGRESLNYRANLLDRSAAVDLSLPLGEDAGGSLQIRAEGIPEPGLDDARELALFTRKAGSFADFGLGARYDEDGFTDTRRLSLDLSANTGLVFAGGRLSLVKNPANSFVLLLPGPSLGGQRIELRSADGSLQALSRAGEPALGSDFKPYERIPVRIEAPESPPELMIRNPALLVATGYRSVTIVRPEAAASQEARGRLLRQGRPVENLYGRIVPGRRSLKQRQAEPGAPTDLTSVPEPEPSFESAEAVGETFTDATGVFYCFALESGDYTIRWTSGEETAFTLEPSFSGIFELGDLELGDPAGKEGP